MSLADHVLAELEAHGTRRCLICSNINPCPDHSWTDQREELARNDAEIARIRAASAIEARQRTDREDGLDPKGESATDESRDAQQVQS